MLSGVGWLILRDNLLPKYFSGLVSTFIDAETLTGSIFKTWVNRTDSSESCDLRGSLVLDLSDCGKSVVRHGDANG